MHQTFKPNALRAAVVAVFGVAAIAAAPTADAQRRADSGRYVVGDFHNHTTCSDGQISVQRLVNKSVDTYGLDWFAMVGHGGSGNRNCTLVDDAQTGEASGFPFVEGQGPSTTWVNSIGADAIKGDLIGTNPTDPNRRMWRWQSIEEYQYPVLERMTALKQKPLFVGLEQVNPGHEHTNVSVTEGQLAPGGGNAAATAEFEYCFDRGDGDLSRGGDGARFNCAVGGSELNQFLDVRGQKLIGAYNAGELGHQKSLEGVKWLGENYPTSSFFIPAHVERAGVFNPNGNAGFNIEHFRNFNNAAPTVAFGYEGGPGHQASSSRSYRAVSPGGGTFGGAGYYMAKVGGLWDAMLGEGRNFWIFNNSDYHNRGAFGPDDVRSTNDQYPGEFNKSYVLVKDGGSTSRSRNRGILTPQEIVDGMRTGNSWYVNGDLIDRLGFVACVVQGRNRAVGRNLYERQIARAALAGEGYENPNCAQQGEKLVVNPGDDVFVHIVVRDPQGTNGSVYTIPNPSLAQVGINIPLNAPVLDHVDLISGMVTGYVSPDSPLYAGAAPGGVLLDAEGNVIPDSPAALNPSTAVRATFGPGNWDEYRNGERRMFFRLNDVNRSQFLRLRGTNIPAAVPFETDGGGNPLLDLLANNITVTPDPVACASTEAQTNDPNCLGHLPAQGAGRQLNNDVEAWTDLWFYSNPIYIEVRGGTVVAGVQ